MDPFQLHQSFLKSANKNLNLIRLLRSKISNQTSSIFQSYEKEQQQTQRQKSLQKSYEQLLLLNEQADLQNQKLQNQIRVENKSIAQLQNLKLTAQLNLRAKQAKIIEAQQQLEQRKQLQKKTEKIEQQNHLLQTKIVQKQSTNKELSAKRQDLRLCVNLLKNQKLLVETKKQKIQAQYLNSSGQRNRQIDYLQRQLEEMKRTIMSMKYELMKQEEQAVKRNKAQTLNDIRQMIKKHRDGQRS